MAVSNRSTTRHASGSLARVARLLLNSRQVGGDSIAARAGRNAQEFCYSLARWTLSQDMTQSKANDTIEMDFERLLDESEALDKTISILIEKNAVKDAQLHQLQNYVFENSQAALDETLVKERELQHTLETLRAEKSQIETEIKQFTEINEKLSECVAAAQKSETPEEDKCKVEDIYCGILDVINEYQTIGSEYSRINEQVLDLSENHERKTVEVKDLICSTQELIVDLQKNDGIIRLTEQQNRYAEQQFDTILGQLPWEPLALEYIETLRNHNVRAIRDLAETLKIQTSDIVDLNESIATKKEAKLKVLEELYSEIEDFNRRRDEAVLIANLASD